MKKGITRTVCGILCGVLLSGSGIMQAALIANAKPTSISRNIGYQWHLQPVIDADNILVGDYTDDAGQQPGFHNYVYIKKNGKYGFIDHEGNIVVEPIYDECNANRYGLDQFRAVYDTKRGESVPVFVGADGVDEIKEGYNWGSSGMPPIGTSHLDGYLWSTADNKMYRVLDDWSYLEINNNESHIVQPSTYSLKSYKSRRFETGAPLSDYAGIGDSKLVSSYFGLACPDRLLVDPEYTYAYANPKDSALYSDNMYFAFAKNKDKWTVFDSQGNKVATDLEPFEENYYYNKVDGTCKLWEYNYTHCKYGYEDEFCVECKEGYYINQTNHLCYNNSEKNDFYKCAFTYQDICVRCADNYFLGKKDNKCSNIKGCSISISGDRCIECEEDYCLDLKTGICIENYRVISEEKKYYYRCNQTNGEGTECEICLDMYKLKDGLCVDDIHCTEEKNNICQKCQNDKEGTFCLNPIFGCVEIFFDNCLRCNDINDFDNCDQCFDGYELDENNFCVEKGV